MKALGEEQQLNGDSNNFDFEGFHFFKPKDRKMLWNDRKP